MVLVCGGRHWGRDRTDRARNRAQLKALTDVLDAIHGRGGIATILEGGAAGADRTAYHWAKRNGVPAETYHADWWRQGKAAGPLRNQRMLDEGKPDLVVACPGGRGTADMLERAQRAGLPIVHVGAEVSV